MGQVHLLKLCVGIDSLQHLRDWRTVRAQAGHRSVVPTRQVPKRSADLLAGGSLYWVIKGQICVRQIIESIEVLEGIAQPCRIQLAPELIETLPQPRRAFQGWRYLEPADAPPDLTSAFEGNLPEEFTQQLRGLGVW